MLDKYGIDRTISDLSEDGKQLVVQAIKNAENKITIQTVAAHWKEIIICILLFGVWFMNMRMTKAEADLAKKNETYDSLKKIETIDATLQKVQENQKTLYPQMDITISQIEMAREQLKAMEKKIAGLTPQQATAQARSLTIDALSKDLAELGYPNTVVKDSK
jgi:myosin heavy subunit